MVANRKVKMKKWKKKKSENVRCMRALEAAQNPEEMAKEQRAVG